MLSTEQIESTRARALSFFNADPEHFDLIFVANATAAIKLVADCISDYTRTDNGFWFGYHADAHTSLVGVRELAARGSNCFQNDQEVERWMLGEGPPLPGVLQPNSQEAETVGLFAFPGQSNMNGRRLPLGWPRRLRSSPKSKTCQVYSLLDAAALVATAPLDFGDHENAPDFTALSFYKIFGYPDLGALIVRKAAGHVLRQRRYFGGGTVDMVISGRVGGDTNDDWFARKATSLHEMLEDGTPPFHSIAALRVALGVHKQLFGSMQNVSRHAAYLAKYMYQEMSMLSHANGLPVCQIYKNPFSTYGDTGSQGPTIAFNLQDSNGDLVGKTDFETLAILHSIQLRTGGLCNPGGIASSLGLSPAQMRENFEEGVRCGNEIDEMYGKPTGVIRVSLGAMSNQKDITTFLTFLNLFIDKSPQTSRSPSLVTSSVAAISKLDGVVIISETAHGSETLRVRGEAIKSSVDAQARKTTKFLPVALLKYAANIQGCSFSLRGPPANPFYHYGMLWTTHKPVASQSPDPFDTVHTFELLHTANTPPGPLEPNVTSADNRPRASATGHVSIEAGDCAASRQGSEA